MFTIIVKTTSGIRTHRADNTHTLVNYAEAINTGIPFSVFWYTILDSATGETVETALINE